MTPPIQTTGDEPFDIGAFFPMLSEPDEQSAASGQGVGETDPAASAVVDEWASLDELVSDIDETPTPDNDSSEVGPALSLHAPAAVAAPHPYPARQARARSEYQRTRTDTIHEAAGAILDAVRGVRADLSGPDVDLDDRLRAIPILHRVVEHAEKLDAEQRGRGKEVPTVHFRFEGGVMSIHMLTRAEADALSDRQESGADVIDAEPVESAGGDK